MPDGLCLGIRQRAYPGCLGRDVLRERVHQAVELPLHPRLVVVMRGGAHLGGPGLQRRVRQPRFDSHAVATFDRARRRRASTATSEWVKSRDAVSNVTGRRSASSIIWRIPRTASFRRNSLR